MKELDYGLEPQPVETPKHLRKLRIGGCVLEMELILKNIVRTCREDEVVLMIHNKKIVEQRREQLN